VANLLCIGIRLDAWLTQTIDGDTITLVGYESVNKAKALIILNVQEVEGGSKITFTEVSGI
jgi:hypothetical protein